MKLLNRYKTICVVLNDSGTGLSLGQISPAPSCSAQSGASADKGKLPRTRGEEEVMQFNRNVFFIIYCGAQGFGLSQLQNWKLKSL
jgi:hypothetical protein